MDKILEALSKGIEKSGIGRKRVCLVTDILYDPEVLETLKIDLFHTSRGRTIPFATGMKLANPKLKPVVIMGDMATLGGNHFVHACRRNMDLLVICANHFVYRRVEGESASGDYDTVSYSPYLLFENPLNIPHIARSCGSVYTARWTALHTDELTRSISHGLKKKGLSVIDVISPPAELLDFYYRHSEIRNGEDTIHTGIEEEKKIIVGEFLERERPTFIESYNRQLEEVLGDQFVKIEV
ncbi:MAG TPA: hypothetical protein ENN03_00410 [bacterium]|nr:hypothetical protein [bacterium]